MNIQNILDALKTDGTGITIEYFKITLPAASADEPPSVIEGAKCVDCGKPFKEFTWQGKNFDAATASEWSKNKNGRALCWNCAKKQESA
jgi:hypothetical protein